MPDQSDNNTPAATAKPDHATVMVGDRVIFEAQPKPPRIKQLDPETFARIVNATGLQPSVSAEHHRRKLYMAVVALAGAIEPSIEEPSDDMSAMADAAKRLKSLCAQYVRADAAPRSAQPPFFLIGPLDHLAEWAKRMERASKKPRGQPRNPSIDHALADVRRMFFAIFATDGPDGRMPAPPSSFNKFVRACLQEIGGIKVGRYWLRDQQRKARGK
ncbi:MAG: hypothetical protein B7Z58_18720 [Acidiphilium sp. 37-64-53]|uniref:hypothetical protein n=1 Tax=Acidiphilium sp. 37-64-53 TaxID=1970299 RepID=UPI000BCB6E75|nr:hypothetical protein [Acidiphilium sp. 37-64-53]OYV99337.1 MAG: hypothetical protein B7Z58_18720 [Acidiphilium sp. 37-64-53]